jgi:predicted nucleotidyltransferase
MMNYNQQSLNNIPHTKNNDNINVGTESAEGTGPGKNPEKRLKSQWNFLSSYDTLFRKSSLRVIIALSQQYSGKFHVRDLSRSLHYDVSIISKNLKYLEHKALVTHEDVGNLVFYQANMNNVLLKQMKIVFTLLELNDLIQDIEPVASNIILYGSCARGDDMNTSDIDLFIETMDKKTVKDILNSFQKKIGRTISPIITTPDETYTMKVKDSNLYSGIHQGIRLKGEENVP